MGIHENRWYRGPNSMWQDVTMMQIIFLGEPMEFHIYVKPACETHRSPLSTLGFGRWNQVQSVQ